MKILEVKSLAIPEIKVIRFGRFCDARGYFTESFRQSDFHGHPQLGPIMRDVRFLQANDAYSKKGVIRGMHFQWNPDQGKLVRTVRGRMVDLVLDIRRSSPTTGKMIAYDIPSHPGLDYADWIWVPPGFAHGNMFPEESQVEYFCSGEWSPGCEAGISPLAADIDWSLCEPALHQMFQGIVAEGALMTDKDRHGLSMGAWLADERSSQFVYG